MIPIKHKMQTIRENRSSNKHGESNHVPIATKNYISVLTSKTEHNHLKTRIEFPEGSCCHLCYPRKFKFVQYYHSATICCKVRGSLLMGIRSKLRLPLIVLRTLCLKGYCLVIHESDMTEYSKLILTDFHPLFNVIN